MGIHHDFDTDKMGVDAGKAMRGPIGAVSPLWWAFAGAATAGVAYWWMTRWARPVNLEAMAPQDSALVEAAATYELQPEAIEEALEPEQAAPRESASFAEAGEAPALEELVEEMEIATAIAAAALNEASDDLTLIVGIGPKLSAALAERGFTQFSHVAAWTEEDIERLDRELKLMGRIARQAWADQARQFMES